MMRFIMPIILIGISVTVFFVFSNPFYKDVNELRGQVESYDQALSNSKALENERDKLTAKFNAINKNDLLKIQKLLPENIDNIRLILEMEQVALPFGMALKDVTYSPTDSAKSTTSSGGAVVKGGGAVQTPNRDYGVWDLSFSTTGTYDNFLNFTRALEGNLRIVDISSVQFSSDTSSGTKTATGSPSPDSYKYDFKIKTYWLKN
ncbi:MAG: hypothetical protein WC735_02540 [Candidatus Paceibacterota bacterium]|jgi:hypothetical protein